MLDLFAKGDFADKFTGKGNGLFARIFGSSNSQEIRNSFQDLAYGLDPLITVASKMTEYSEGGFRGIVNIVNSLSSIKSLDTTKLTTLYSMLVVLAETDFSNLGNQNVANSLISLATLVELLNNLKDFGKEFVIKPVLDLSQFNAGYNNLSSMLGNISGGSNELATNIALRSSNKPNSEAVSTTNNTYSDVYNVTMNIETNDPVAIADQLDSIFEQRNRAFKVAKGI